MSVKAIEYDHQDVTVLTHATKQGFDKDKRLIKPCEFKRVFDNPDKKIHSLHLLLFVKKNCQSMDCQAFKKSRLGLAITKKKLKKAIMRNRLKRLVREQFRLSSLHQDAAFGCDVVFIVKASYTKDFDISKEVSQIFHKLTFYLNTQDHTKHL